MGKLYKHISQLSLMGNGYGKFAGVLPVGCTAVSLDDLGPYKSKLPHELSKIGMARRIVWKNNGNGSGEGPVGVVHGGVFYTFKWAGQLDPEGHVGTALRSNHRVKTVRLVEELYV